MTDALDQTAGGSADGSAGDADYGVIGGGYSTYRRPDPRIARVVEDALGGARTVVNVGAGAGSYEPAGAQVTAVEPSAAMRAQRPVHLAPAIDGTAERLPFDDGRFDAAMTTFSVHQWSDTAAGLREMRRVTRGPVVVMTCDPTLVRDFWLYDYAPLVLDTEARRYPAVEAITAALGGSCAVTPVPIPADCTDGFNEAYYARPERLLDPGARQACSAWSFVPQDVCERYTGELRAAIASGAWDARHGALRRRPYLDGSLVLIRSMPDPVAP
ncbi:Methyltransferase domain-containing protein [Actinacidiphila yanglinensis]|uniref:Methyltransferase domain-containing protein n=1 Tax=Actinacidiphila yanglinensis TaxID=310779 RepID=A0A1H6CVV3_9ACTN|nr:class I SAM-dependent methyltransferase [Actinacidiphila yanglinensis]SEG76978.1 Methyltransferase domain-containing protein [Actinacidiphila yanglinensis]